MITFESATRTAPAAMGKICYSSDEQLIPPQMSRGIIIVAEQVKDVYAHVK